MPPIEQESDIEEIKEEQGIQRELQIKDEASSAEEISEPSWFKEEIEEIDVDCIEQEYYAQQIQAEVEDKKVDLL